MTVSKLACIYEMTISKLACIFEMTMGKLACVFEMIVTGSVCFSSSQAGKNRQDYLQLFDKGVSVGKI